MNKRARAQGHALHAFTLRVFLAEPTRVYAMMAVVAWRGHSVRHAGGGGYVVVAPVWWLSFAGVCDRVNRANKLTLNT